MLTRKDHVAIAKIIALSRIGRCGVFDCCQDIIYRLADYFEQDNPTFDQQKFLDAYFED